jgi:hypothetical protein
MGRAGKLVKTTGIIHTVTGTNFFLQTQPTKRWASIQVYLGAQLSEQEDMPTILGQISVSIVDNSKWIDHFTVTIRSDHTQ